MHSSKIGSESQRIGEEIITRAQEILTGCRTMAFDGKTPIYAPDEKRFYNGVYWRDFCYMVEGFAGLLPLEDVEAIIRYLLDPPLLEGRVFPKSRNEDGELWYNWRYPFRTWCSADNPMFAVKVMHEYLKRGGDKQLFKSYPSKIERGMSSVRFSKNSLVEDPVGPYIYGFYDTVFLTGEECFASVLFIDAVKRLAEMYEQIGDAPRAAYWRETAGKTEAGLSHLWIEDENMFLSDTLTNRRIDVWGSAYAVYSGAVERDKAKKISEWFVENFDRCVRWGHVRHLPSPEYWKKTGHDALPPGQYQNGGYWSVPAPWVVHTIALTNEDLAKQMCESLEDALLKFDFPECINEDGTCKLPGYTASAAMGLLALKFFEREK